MAKGTLTQASATQTIPPERGYGGSGLAQTVFISGTWGGATVKLQALAKQIGPAAWFDIKDVQGNALSFIADGYANFFVRSNALRLVASGATGTTSLNWQVE